MREQVPADRRAVRIRLTPHARTTLPRIEAHWRKLADTATAGFDPAERVQLVSLLDRVRDNLLALPADGDAACPGRADSSARAP